MDNNSDASYQSESEFYYGDEWKHSWFTRLFFINFPLVNDSNDCKRQPKRLSPSIQDLGQSFSRYGPPSREMTYIYWIIFNINGAIRVSDNKSEMSNLPTWYKQKDYKMSLTALTQIN